MDNFLQHIIILLDDISPSFCHAENPMTQRKLISLEFLKKGILFAMKENLQIQYALPPYALPDEYRTLMQTMDYLCIGEDVKVYSDIGKVTDCENVILRLSIADFITNVKNAAEILSKTSRLNICFIDIDKFDDSLICAYRESLRTLKRKLFELITEGKTDVQCNLLTDRLQLSLMNNCGAGINNITLAPNGKFYLCPAFYYDERSGLDNRKNYKTSESDRSVGDIDGGLDIPDKQLLQLDYAPICRICDAFHCNRCLWLNQRLTLNINTPSRQQCVMAHIERNVARELQQELIDARFTFENLIPESEFLDPFEKILKGL